MNNRYVVVNSGLPWWTTTKPGQGNFTTLVDKLFQGSRISFCQSGNDNRIAEGYFDQNWKLQAADAQKLKENGAVVSGY
jgi:hypothetical protein